MNRFVLDASVTLCWCFEGQSSAYTEAILERFARGDQASVPSIWPLEVANALVTAERRKDVDLARSTSFIDQLISLPIHVDSSGMERCFTQVIAVARQYRLSGYDAAYVELALRQGSPLATVDAAIKGAAKAAGIKLAYR